MLDRCSRIQGLESRVHLSCRWVHLVGYVSKLFGLDPDATVFRVRMSHVVAVAVVVAEAVVLTSCGSTWIASERDGIPRNESYLLVME